MQTLPRDVASARPMRAPDRTLPELFLIGFVCGGLGYILLQGFHLGIANFFTPIHHDDFSALGTAAGFQPFYPRPVSSNLIYNLGSLGAGFYYAFFFCLSMACLALTQIVAFQVVNVRPGPLDVAIGSFLTSAAWFSLAPSVMTLQYLGLATNALSYFFGFVAAACALLPQAHGVRFRHYLVFLVLVLLAAFSKEDLAPFLILVCLYRGYRDAAATSGGRSALVPAAVMFALCVVAYAASVAHSRIVGSPFLGGAGPYDLSNPVVNAWRNTRLYVTASTGMTLVSIWVVAALVLGLVGFARRPSPLWAGILALPVFALALMLPYVLLPRFVDYYAVNFVPFALAGIVPASICILGGSRLSRWSAPGAIAAAAAILLYFADLPARNGSMGWHVAVREASRRQLDEVRRAEDTGMRACRTVLVSGVSAGIGPFLAASSAPLDHLIGRDIRWRIVAEPNTIVRMFADATPMSDPAWTYVPPEEASGPEWSNHSDCALRFDPQTMRATLEKRRGRP